MSGTTTTEIVIGALLRTVRLVFMAGLLLSWSAPASAQVACDISDVGVGGDGVWAVVASDSTLVTWGTDAGGHFASTPAGTFSLVDADQNNACGVRTTGALACWGADTWRVVTDVPAGTSWADVATGAVSACARNTSNAVTCWGAANTACTTNADCTVTLQECSGGNCNTHPTNPWTDPTTAMSKIGGTQDNYCGTKASDGSIECWGFDYGTLFDSEPAGTGYKDVTATLEVACAIKSDDTLICWGDNTYGHQTEPAGTYTDVATDAQTACAVKSDGSIECWGDDSNDGITNKPAGTNFVSVDVWDTTFCAVTSTNGVTCWGGNFANEVTSAPSCTTTTTTTTTTLAAMVVFVGS